MGKPVITVKMEIDYDTVRKTVDHVFHVKLTDKEIDKIFLSKPIVFKPERVSLCDQLMVVLLTGSGVIKKAVEGSK